MNAEIKGSSMEERIKGQAQAELSGAGMYFALAKAAKEHHMDEVAERFTEIALEHADQSSGYFSLVGRYPYDEQDFWQFIKGLSKAEECGDSLISDLAGQVTKAGFADAGEMIKTFAAQHRHHAEVTSQMLEKYAPDTVKENSKKQYVCSICGYVYEGDLENEPDDFTCPLCGMPKEVFGVKG